MSNPVDADTTTSPEAKPRFTHGAKFFAAVVIGLTSSPFLWKATSTHELADQISVRPPLIVGVIYVLLACYAAFHYVKHLRAEEGETIPFFERYIALGVVLLALAATHFCGAVVSVDQQELVIFEPVLALLGNTNHKFDDLRSIELGRDRKGKEVLLLMRKGATESEPIGCDALVRPVLPRLSTAAKAKGVKVVGF